MILKQSFRFEAAHRLPRHRGRCSNLHGHAYRFTVAIESPVDPASGMVRDFEDVESVVAEKVLERWDHRDLNEFMENPTAENIVVAIWRILAEALPGLREIELWETQESGVVYRGESESR